MSFDLLAEVDKEKTPLKSSKFHKLSNYCRMLELVSRATAWSSEVVKKPCKVFHLLYFLLFLFFFTYSGKSCQQHWSLCKGVHTVQSNYYQDNYLFLRDRKQNSISTSSVRILTRDPLL